MNQPLDVIQPPRNAPPQAGRFVVDFGNETATGLTGAQVARLLDSEQFRHIRVYRIHRALPNGQMELVGLSHARFGLEDGLVFVRENETAARADFEQIAVIADADPAPCRARVHLVRLPDSERACATVVLFPAEHSEDFSAWLLRNEYRGGDRVDGGTSAAAEYLGRRDALVVDRLQLWGALDGTLAEQGGGMRVQRAAG